MAEYKQNSLVEVPFNEIISLSRSEYASLYVSMICEHSADLNLPYRGRITCGRGNDNDIRLTFPIVSGSHFQIMLVSGRVQVQDLGSTNHLYLNGQRINSADMSNGDVLSIYTARFILKNGVLGFYNMGSALTLPKISPEKDMKAAEEKVRQEDLYLHYHLSPRTREQLPHEDIILSAAPGPGKTLGGQKGNMAYLIGTGAMMAASLASGMVSPVMLLARLAGMVSPLANMAMMRKLSKEEQEQLAEYERLRHETYEAYIADQKARIKKIADTQRRILVSENPDSEKCMTIARELQRRLWERMPSDSDFLHVRLGLGNIKLCVEVKTRADVDGYHMYDDDELEKLSERIIEETRYVDHAPVRLPLNRYPTIGVIGTREDVYYEIRSMLVELTALHSPRDVHVLALFGEGAQKNWGHIRWIPHLFDETGQTRYIAFDQKRIHEICELLGQVIRTRSSTNDDFGQKDAPALPHYVLIVEDRDLIRNEPIYPSLLANDPSLGITTVFLGRTMYDLPQNCRCIVDLSDGPCIYETDRYDERVYFTQDPPVHQKEMGVYSRRLAAIELEDLYAEAALPNAITFLQGYGVETVEDLQILNRWKESEPYNTLAAPIGMMSGHKLFSLNIRSGDQSHGPHGLVAGTTGSGKSELLQTWILSMAVNYHPHDVNFVIIDYKGGGMSDLLEPLPHVVGKITNIDRNISRALVSLKSELKRRERLFAWAGVNNLDKYQQAYKSGRTDIRLPHLIIVTDEFAELKKEEPDFMAELNSVATTGRSLGVHMVLATQKPAGVVNDQINSNSRFRICMKVQDVLDSREMLKRPDAARITQSGRAYIRVGEDELFELFQSFYSAAPYTGRASQDMANENQVRIIGVTGNRINPVKKKKQKTDGPDQLTAVISHIQDLCEMIHLEKNSGPWLPELPKWLPLDSLLEETFREGSWQAPRPGLSVPIGKYDLPEQQEQGTVYLDLENTGHYAIYGIPGSGKTVFLKTAVLSLGLHYTPKEVRITILDAGSWSLSEFTEMPHVDAVILNQDEDKLKHFAVRLYKELEGRKHAFLKAAVSSLRAYHESVSSDLPAIVIVVDNIIPIFEQNPETAEVLEKVAETGMQYGIYLVFTANSTVGVKYKFSQMIKGAVALQMSEKGEYSGLVGPIGNVSLPYFNGRGLLRRTPPVAFQTAMYIDKEDDAGRHDALAALLKEMSDAWQKLQDLPAGEPQKEREEPSEVRENVTSEERTRTCLLLGKDTNTFEPVRVDLAREHNVLLISSRDNTESEAALEYLEKELRKHADNQIYRLSPETPKEEIDRRNQELVQILNERKKIYDGHKLKEDFDQAKWISGYAQLCLVISQLPDFCAGLEAAVQKSFGRIFSKGKEFGVLVIASAAPEKLALSEADQDLLTHAALLSGIGLGLGERPIDHTAFADVKKTSAELTAYLDDDEAALFQDGDLCIIRKNWG
ncbi:MAG: type VII secretion protein EssC [Eubacteriales bacterium]|nr:type VII secretion protein EssC [Eubacteriales bacterium]